MNRLVHLALYGVNEALKTVRCLTDAVTTRRYCEGFGDGLTYPLWTPGLPKESEVSDETPELGTLYEFATNDPKGNPASTEVGWWNGYAWIACFSGHAWSREYVLSFRRLAVVAETYEPAPREPCKEIHLPARTRQETTKT